MQVWLSGVLLASYSNIDFSRDAHKQVYEDVVRPRGWHFCSRLPTPN